MKNKITIIIPLFNRASLIQETLKSIQEQTIKEWKCIIVDDGSTDKSCKLVNDITKNDSRFKLIQRTREPKGANTCRNIGLSMVKTEWVMFFDSDDIMLPHCIEKRIIASQENKNYELLFFQGVTFSKRGVLNFRNNPKSEDYVKDILSFNVTLSTPVAIWKTNFIRRINAWTENLHRWQDSELFIRVLQTNVKYKWISEYPDHLVRREIGLNRITNSNSKYDDFETLMNAFANVFGSLNESNKKIFRESLYYVCLKSSYFISPLKNKIIIDILEYHSMISEKSFLN